MRQASSLRQKEADIKLISARYSETYTKLKDLSLVLTSGTFLAELYSVTTTTDLNVSLVISEMRFNAGVDAATMDNTWGIGIEAAKRTRLASTQRGIRRMINPSMKKRYNTNDRQL
jgi:hypothetical protein